MRVLALATARQVAIFGGGGHDVESFRDEERERKARARARYVALPAR